MRLFAAVVLGLAVVAAPVQAEEAGLFASPCGFSHRAPDDPIVAPGQPGQSHLHDFFGNAATDAHSTHQTLLAGPTTCRRPLDRAGYWVPALYLDGRPVAPEEAQIYYRAGRADRTAVRPPPPGLRVVAGDAKATGPQSMEVVNWRCATGARVGRGHPEPICAAGRKLTLQVRFPSCWDGRNLDSADHKSHMAYTYGSACPASHPVPLPLLTVNVLYPTPGGPGVTLASGPPHTAHGDFFNGWDQAALTELVRECVNDPLRQTACHPGGGPGPMLAASADSLEAGEALSLDGKAAYEGTPLRLDVDGVDGWHPLAQLVAGTEGAFDFAFAPEHTARLRAVDEEGRASARVTVPVRPRLIASVRSSRARRGRLVRLVARTVPAKPALVCRIDRREKGRWRTVRRMPVRVERGAARTRVRLGRRGSYRVIAEAPEDELNAANESRPVAVRVR